MSGLRHHPPTSALRSLLQAIRVRIRLKCPVMRVASVLWSRWLSDGEKLCSQAISSSNIWETSTGGPWWSSGKPRATLLACPIVQAKGKNHHSPLESASKRQASSKYSTHWPSNLRMRGSHQKTCLKILFYNFSIPYFAGVFVAGVMPLRNSILGSYAGWMNFQGLREQQ